MTRIRINSRHDLDVRTNRLVEREKPPHRQLEDMLLRVPRGWQVERVRPSHVRVRAKGMTLDLRALTYCEATVTYQDELAVTRRARDLTTAVRAALAHATSRGHLTANPLVRDLRKALAF